MSYKRKFAAPALADTIARAIGRCSLKENGHQALNGSCTIKRKQNGRTRIFVVELDNGTRFRFSGSVRQQLHEESDSGIGINEMFEDQGSKGVFTWNDGGSTHRLAVTTEVVTNPKAQIDDHPSTGKGAIVVGSLVGGLIGAILGGGQPSGAGGAGVEGQPVPERQSMPRSDTGSVESRLSSSGHSHTRSHDLNEDEFESFWKRGGSCMNAPRINNRSASFSLANPANCN